MVRYFFHLEGPEASVDDDEGTSFETLEEAKEHAHIVAYEIGKNTEARYQGYKLHVVGPDGKLLFTVPVGDPGRSM
jgi:hypothetical protein